MTMTLPMSTSIPVILPVPLYLSMIAYYHLVAPKFKTEKQRAYVLSTLSSGLMTCVSIPFLWTYLRHGLMGLYGSGTEGWMARVGEVGVVFFGVYLFADLSLGYFRYPSQIGLLTGWVHHTVYIGLMVYCLSTLHSPIFLAAAIMELPTFDLAISNLFPKVRNDLRFLSSFFLIRIVYNFIFLLDTLRPSSRTIMGGSWVPPLMLFAAGCLHVSWFQGGVMGYIKRHRAPIPIKTSLAEPTATPTLDTSLSNNMVPAIDLSAPPSPDETPLLTPRTPSITPFSLRDSYLPTLPPLPKLGVPSLPTLPGLSDLNLNISNPFPNTRDLNFGFKDAVKHHWEDRRLPFEGMGMGMGLNLGGLGLRRRARKEDVVIIAEETEVRIEEVSIED